MRPSIALHRQPIAPERTHGRLMEGNGAARNVVPKQQRRTREEVMDMLGITSVQLQQWQGWVRGFPQPQEERKGKKREEFYALAEVRRFLRTYRNILDANSQCAEEDVFPTDEATYMTLDQAAADKHVSRKTVDRWFRDGLRGEIARIGGRMRKVVTAQDLQTFEQKKPGRIARASAFSRMTQREKESIIREAEALAREGIGGAVLIAKVAMNAERSNETIRYLLRRYRKKYPESPLAVFTSQSPERQRQRIIDFHRKGMPDKIITQQCSCSLRKVQGILTQSRYETIKDLPLDFMPNNQFKRVSMAMEQKICGPMPPPEEKHEKARRPAEIPEYLASLYEVPLLTREQEQHLFRKMNYLKYKASALRDSLDPKKPKSGFMDRIERLYGESVAVKNDILRANLRLVVSIAKRYVGGGQGLFDLVSDGNMSLIRAVEKFDFARGNKFSTYATWALLKNFARSIPAEKLHATRNQRLEDQEIDSQDERADYHEKERMQAEREEIVEGLLEALDERETKIILARFGLVRGQEPLNLKEIGEAMGVTKERIRQIELRAMYKLRKAASEANISLDSVEQEAGGGSAGLGREARKDEDEE